MVEHYRAASHKAFLINWLRSRGLDLSLCESLPRTGYVSSYNGKIVAAAFLRKCEGGLAMIDSLISDPEMPGPVRHGCIEEIVKKLISCAKTRRVKQIIAYSVDDGTLMRAESHGFVRLPHVLVGLNLGEQNGIR